MGYVLKGRDKNLDRICAIKLIKSKRLGDVKAMQRFEREVKGLARIEHPHIVRIYQYDDEDPQAPFFTMEYIDGISLREALKKGGLDVNVFCQQIIDVGEGIASMHAAGMLHRDIKPENIVIEQGGRAVLMDFGVVSAEDANNIRSLMTTRRSSKKAKHKKKPKVPGTLQYMAPELLRGFEASPRSDLYALGVIIYEAAAGRRPLSSEDIIASLEDPSRLESIPLSERNSRITAEFATLVEHALDPAPERRWPSVADFIERLEGLMDANLIVRAKGASDEAASRSSRPSKKKGKKKSRERPRRTKEAKRPQKPLDYLPIILGIVFLAAVALYALGFLP
jgi:serine/threonine protein kinase